MEMKPVTAIIVGAGHRSMAYADFSLRHPDKLKIVGVADPDKFRQKMVSEKFGFSKEFCFDSAEELAKVNVTVPNIVGRTAHMGVAALQKYGLQGTIIGSGDRVIKQVPAAGQSVPRGGSVVIYTEDNTQEKTVVVPKLVGLTATEVSTRLGALGLNAKIMGGGIDQTGCLSSKQSVAAGERVPVGTVVEVTFLSKDEVQ